MKLLSFKNNKNSSFGLLEDQYIIDLKHYFGPNINSLKEALNILTVKSTSFTIGRITHSQKKRPPP